MPAFYSAFDYTLTITSRGQTKEHTLHHIFTELAAPDATNESTKGGVRWRSGEVVGRWELDVFFRADETVGAAGKRWRWNW